MKAMIRVESKRIVKSFMTLVFFAVVVLLSVNSSYQALNSYELWNYNGYVASGLENLKHGKENTSRIDIEQAIAMQRENGEAVYVDETNIEKLVKMNYSDRTAKELSDKEINRFLESRLRIILRRLDESSHFTYTEKEKEGFLERAGKLTRLTIGYAEGWKVLNRDMGKFIPLVLFMISVLVMPLFADDTQNKMKELTSSARNGKKRLILARFVSAFMMGSVFYLSAVVCYFVIKMLPFGFEGSGELIQSNADTFFSTYTITYWEQFLINCLRGYVTLVFVVALTVLISAMAERIMMGSAIICFFWLLLFVMEKMAQFEVNHCFANFLPLRLAGSADFYTLNEVYRFGGNSFDGIAWCLMISMGVSVIMLALAAIWLMKERLMVRASMRQTRTGHMNEE
ncbi:MAG: hypothetical protein HFH36_04765 [Lachnospiraceae bacterium]|nr:hypothetical protein [Lachnospiraceae bacterium]